MQACQADDFRRTHALLPQRPETERVVPFGESLTLRVEEQIAVMPGRGV